MLKFLIIGHFGERNDSQPENDISKLSSDSSMGKLDISEHTQKDIEEKPVRKEAVMTPLMLFQKDRKTSYTKIQGKTKFSMGTNGFIYRIQEQNEEVRARNQDIKE